MSRNIQEYINSLVNKSRVYYLDLNNHFRKQGYQCSTCHQNLAGKCENCNNQNKQLTGEISNLNEFNNLKGINTSNNQFTSLNFLNSLPNKDKLRGINLFGNQIQEIDFAELFTKFPNLAGINLQNNPVKAKNLNNLTTQQFNQLVQGIKAKKIRVDSFKGTVLMDLLEHAQKLASQGRPEYQAYVQTLSTINQPSRNNEQPNHKSPLLMRSLIILGFFVLGIGYRLGKKRKNSFEYE